MPLRILHSIHSVNPASGGVIEGVTQLAAINQRDGHTVEIVSMDSPEDAWVKGCPINCHAMGHFLGSYGYSPRFVAWLRAHRRDYDVVIVNGIWQFSSFGVWLALKGTTTPYFVFTHGMLDPWFKRTYPLKHLKKWLYWFWADYRVLRDATAVLFTSEEERRLARQSFWLYKCDECVVNYGTVGPKGDKAAQKRAFLDRFPHLADKRCLLFLGRVHVKKGPDLLLRALEEVLRQGSVEQTKDLHLVIAGPANHHYAHGLKSKAEKLGLGNRVTWTGMLAGDLKWGAFYASEAFVLPSHQENFGVAVAEAMACGLPVLISNKINIWREIQLSHSGLVETDDLGGTRLLLKNWLKMPETERNEMRRHARRCFEERFHIDRAAGQFIQLLNTFALFGVGV